MFPGAVDEATADLGFRLVSESLPGLIIILFVPVFGALLHLTNRGGGAFVAHLVTALHIHTVFFIGVVVTLPLDLMLGSTWEKVGAPVLLLALLAFLVAVVARVYRLPIWRAAIRTLIVMVGYLVVVVASFGFILDFVLSTG
jgi:hypothetical protein